MGNVKIGVFGCGNMGAALVQGIRASSPDADFYLYTPTQTKAQVLADLVGGKLIANLEDMTREIDWYFLCFKPQSLDDFSFDFPSSAKIMSVLAGVSIEKLSQKFKSKKIGRLMPNTPSSLGEGANLFFLNQNFSPREEELFLELLKGTGRLFKMHTEDDLNLTTAFSGSGPALIFELARIFEEELSLMTQGRVSSREIIAQTFLGSSKLMRTEFSFEELRSQVTSKKGVTSAALESLNSNNLQDIFKEAFQAAYKRTLELSK